MASRKSETALLSAEGFAAAIEAAEAAAHAGDDHQEQLAAGIVAYCTYAGATGFAPIVSRHAVSTTCAQDIGAMHAENSK